MLILIGSSLLAAAQPAAPASTPPAKPVKEKKICRVDTTTGSMLPKTVCHTQAQWEDIEVANRNVAPLRRYIQQTTASPNSQ